MPENRTVRPRLLFLVLAPAIIICLTTLPIVYFYFEDLLTRQTTTYGEATAAQIADHLTEYVVDNDLVSLNVLVSRLQESGHISSLAVYDARGNLLSQAGKEENGTSFTQELSFQDAMVGRVTLTVADIPEPSSLFAVLPLVAVLFLALITVFLWSFADFVYLWIPVSSRIEKPEEEDVVAVEPASDVCILVIKVRPRQYLELYLERFVQAAKLYQGESESLTADELVFVFRTGDAVFLSICAGLLIKQLTELIKPNITFGGAIDLIGDVQEKTKKHVAYLASIAEGQLLVSDDLTKGHRITDRVKLQEFHHSLINADSVHEVSRLVNQELLASQAEQLTSKT